MGFGTGSAQPETEEQRRRRLGLVGRDGAAPPPPPAAPAAPGVTTTPGPVGEEASPTRPGEYTNDGQGGSAFEGNTSGSATPGEEIRPAKYTDATAAVANDVYQARVERDRLLSEYWNHTPREAPKASTPTLGPAAQSDAVTVGPAAQSTAPTVAPAVQATPTKVGPTALAAAAPQVTAQQVDPTRIAPIERAAAGQITAERATAAQMDLGDQSQVRARQMSLLNNLEGIASGAGGPTVSELQARRSTDDAIASQAALAGTVHGYGALSAHRTAARNTAALQQQGATTAAMARAQEMRDSRDMLLRGLEGTRGADIGVSTTDAQLRQQTSLQNSQLGTQASIAQAGLDTDVSKTNAGATNTTNIRQAELNQQGSIANQQAALDAAKANQTSTVQTNLANAAQSNEMTKLQAQIDSTTGLTNAQAQNRMAELQAQIQSQNGIANAQQQNELTKLQAQITTQNQQFNAQAKNDFLKSEAGMQLQTGLANLNAELTSRGLDDKAREAALNAYLENQRAALGWDTVQAGLNAANDEWKRELGKDLVAGLINQMSSNAAQAGKMGGAPTSDRRAKTGIKPLYSDERGKERKKLLASYGGGDGEVEELLEALHPSSYHYKDPKADGAAPGRRYGVMAQDLERSAMGKSIVIEDSGVKKIDPGQAIGLLLASVARMHDRVKKVEGRR